MDYKKLSILLGGLLTAFVLAFVIVPLCCGYELGVASLGGWNLEDTYQVAGVVAPFVGIFVAVWIPKKIAEEQNKIALFDKRFEIYQSLRCYMQCYVHFLNTKNKNSEIKNSEFLTYFYKLSEYKQPNKETMREHYQDFWTKLSKIEFLFPNVDRNFLDKIKFSATFPLEISSYENVMPFITDEEYQQLVTLEQKMKDYVIFD